MDWGFVIGLGAIALVVIGSIIYFGRKLSGFVRKHAPESDLAMRVTPTGNALAACMAGFWGACIIAFKLAPKSTLGAFLGTTDGVLVVILGSIFFWVTAAIILDKFGYPIARRGSRGT